MSFSAEWVTKLTQLLTAAVVCCSAPAAWLTLWYGRVDKHEERLNREFQSLATLEREVDHIRHWTEPGYDETSHDVQWFNPYWSVLAFPSANIEAFPLTTAARFFGVGLADPVGLLVAAIARFRALLAGHNQFLSETDDAFRRRLLSVVQPRFPENGGPGLTLADVDTLAELSVPERAWLREVYRRNKEVHALGIGKAREPGRLFESRASAAAAIVIARERAPRDPVPQFVGVLGHLFATLFALVGAWLLVLAVLSAGPAPSPDRPAEDLETLPRDSSLAMPARARTADSFSGRATLQSAPAGADSATGGPDSSAAAHHVHP